MKWLLSAILVLAIFLRLPLLTGSFWLDEAAQALESTRPLSQQLQIRDDFQPPLLHLLVHFSLFFSRSEWWLRLVAAFIPGILTILVTYKIGEKIANKKVGLLAAFLLSTSSFHLFYSQELRQYSLPAFFASLSWLTLINLIQQKKVFERKNAFFFFLITTFGLYTSYLYPFLLISQIIYIMLFHRKLWLPIFSATFTAVLAFLPWLPSFLGQLEAGQSLRQDLPGWQEVVSFNQIKSIALILGKFTFGILDLELNVPFVSISLLLVAGFGFSLFHFFKNNNFKLPKALPEATLLFLTWLVIPIGLAWFISFLVPVLQPKRVLYCLPAFYLLISWFIFEMTNSVYKMNQKVLFTLGLLLIVMNLFSSWSYFTQPKYQREDWRSMHALIVSQYPAPSSVAVFAFPAPFAPWEWYDDGHYPTFSTGQLTTSSQENLENSHQLTEYRFILVFDYLRDLTDPQDKVLTQLEEYGYHEVDQITPETPLGFVRVYAKSLDVIGLLDRSL